MPIEFREYQYSNAAVETEDHTIMNKLGENGGEHVSFIAGKGLSVQDVRVGDENYCVERFFQWGYVSKVRLLKEVPLTMPNAALGAVS